MKMCHQQAYRDQQSTLPLQANYRFNIQHSDLSRLYAHHHKSLGIDIKKRPEINVNDWLDQDSPNFQRKVASSVFHYHPRMSHGDRFELFIATPNMEQAAWAYVHKSQLILDGTFGVSSSRLLLWIAMGLDAQGKGIPVAMFLFSAPAGSLATHSGYNIGILSHLLKTWKDWLSSRGSAANRIFEPAVAITDTDVKERGALTLTWPSIRLLLCKFHLRQCWTNRRSITLRQRETHLGIYAVEWIKILESS
jgi:hypothetical protein